MLTQMRFASSGVTGLSKLIVDLRLAADTVRHRPFSRARARSTVAYVGDAFEEEIDSTGEQAAALGKKGIPIFMFQEGTDETAESAFREIAKLSNGTCARFDVGSAKQLEDLLRTVGKFATSNDYLALSHAREALRQSTLCSNSPDNSCLNAMTRVWYIRIERAGISHRVQSRRTRAPTGPRPNQPATKDEPRSTCHR